MGEMNGFGLYQSHRNMESVEHDIVFGLWWCWGREGGWHESVRVESRLFVYMAGTGIYIFY